MKAIVTLEHRFIEHEGKYYTSGAFEPGFWQRYLSVFSEVLIVARVKSVESLSGAEIRVCGDRLSFFPLPYYVGFKQGIKSMSKMRTKLKSLVKNHNGAYILRVGSPIADILNPILEKNKIPFAVEVVGDPWDVFAKGAIDHPARIFLRRYFAFKLKQQCAKATFSSYVTQHALQKRYPPISSIKTIHASSIKLDEEFFFHEKNFNEASHEWLFVGTLEQYQKAPDVLLKSFQLVVQKFPNAKLSFIGDGRERVNLEILAKGLGIKDNVTFLGKLSSPEAVREHLIRVPFFVLPSRGEGLPRAMIEAMACGCVCVGSRIGGIQELIDEEWIAEVNNHKDLADKMIGAMEISADVQKELSNRNIQEAKAYLSPILDKRRFSFYSALKEHVESVK